MRVRTLSSPHTSILSDKESEVHTQITHPSGFTTITTERILNTLDDEPAAPPEGSIEHHRLTNTRHHRNLHVGVNLVSPIIVWLVEE